MSTREERRQFWLNHIQSWQKSDQTQAVYCQTHQLNKKSFWYWKRKIKKGSGETNKLKSTTNHFVELPVAQQSYCPPPDTLTISLPNGISIEGIHAGNLFLLKDLTGLLQ